MDPKLETSYIRTIEWEMLDKKKFLPLSIASSLTVRTTLYPFTLVKTRLQIQKGNEVYRGTWDAFRKIVKYEGLTGLYKGFWVNLFSIVSGAFYVVTYENVRHILQVNNVTDTRVRALIGGGCASLVGQTIIVPIDVVSQHLMMVGQKTEGAISKVSNPDHLVSKLQNSVGKSKTQLALAVTKDIYKTDGLRGFYRGYTASLFTYVPSSSLWWTFYHLYQDHLLGLFPSWVSHLGIQCTSAILGGITTTTLINPLDIVRARLQVQRLNSIGETFRILWREERFYMFTKGLTARIIMSTFYSFSIILGYESVKRWSVKEQYREQIRW
uniref:EOG090X08ST n=1 Tax=Scapholeberis mucronata TaxID=202097 RepID=A0A4Y7NKF4_9CRUS|nr:EOG090X08ST [Scapholeberis mucronata]SVE93711.1 EOG090X08ST [Scapholeberis mucronata]